MVEFSKDLLKGLTSIAVEIGATCAPEMRGDGCPKGQTELGEKQGRVFLAGRSMPPPHSSNFNATR